jgi:hypothetical protein
MTSEEKLITVEENIKNEEVGTITFKITLLGGKKDSEELIKILVESLREEIK